MHCKLPFNFAGETALDKNDDDMRFSHRLNLLGKDENCIKLYTDPV